MAIRTTGYVDSSPRREHNVGMTTNLLSRLSSLQMNPVLQLRRSFYLVSLICCYSVSGYSASFDCESKLKKIEEIICADGELLMLDEILNTTYGLTFKISENKSALKLEQRNWLTSIRNRCKDEQCVGRVYEDRITELEKIWERQTRAIDLARARQVVPTSSPFEGEWQSCQLWRGEPICSTSTFVQLGKNVCGESEEWASGRYYTSRIQATQVGSNQVKMNFICDITSGWHIECDPDDRDQTKWEKISGLGFSICEGRLQSGDGPCSPIGKAGDEIYKGLTEKRRKELLSESWIQRCLKQR